ncbi:response regulator [Bermanella sp. WJH001]|uniref:response regulator n=1 Tax=Bermanella sp. WJH001 TaxID=3048005 RepID=UPI0024BECCB3|nr:response regulator [Bermanella sp. WJH001]MDJ1537743.1 response regulator [Bermanella sp. WJH001]
MTNKILMIDDDIDDQYLFGGLLSNLDDELVVEYRDNPQVLFDEYANVDKEPKFIPNLILLDLNLPKFKGTDIFLFIKENQWLKEVPVLVLTTSSSPLDIQDCKNLGLDGYFVKPMDFEDSQKIIENIYRYWFVYNELTIQNGKS